MKKSIYIFGTGTGKNIVRHCLTKSVYIKGYIDNDIHKQGKIIDGVKVFSVEQVNIIRKDIFIVSPMNQYREIYIQLVERGVKKNQIISFFDPEAIKNPEFKKVLNVRKWLLQYLKFSVCKIRKDILGSWHDIFGELEHMRSKTNKASIVVIGANKYSEFFAIKAKKYVDSYKGDVYAFDSVDMSKNLKVSVKDFEELLYLNKANKIIYVIDPPHVKKILEALFEMGVKKKNVKVLGELQPAGVRFQNIYDIHLGYTWINNKFPGFAVFRDAKNTKRAFRIVTLGGSTSDPTLLNIKSWPEQLYEKLKNMGINVEVFAGGMGAYVCTQELQKFIRDVMVLKPDMIISYSGINDAYDYYHEPGHPFVLFYQAELLKKMVKMQIRNLLMDKKKIAGYTYGLKDKSTTWEHWLYCERIMHTISEEYGIKFYAFLQPYNKYIDGNYISDKSWRDIERFYSGVKDYMSRHTDSQKWLQDFTSIFDKKENIFFDHCHVYEKGNKIIAGRILPYVLRAIEEV